jgi:hypothetical protein
VIGGNYIVNETKADNSIDELRAVLEQRAATINSELQKTFKYVKVKKYLEDFNRYIAIISPQ